MTRFVRMAGVALAAVGCVAIALPGLFPSATSPTSDGITVNPGVTTITDPLLYPAAPSPSTGTSSTASAPGVTLQEAVYFGACWQFIQRLSTDGPIVLGGGWANPIVIRSADGIIFAGTVEKLDAGGQVTDVVVMFAGAETPNDHANGFSILLNIPSEQAQAAVRVFERVRGDPRYGASRIHVMGHSLGAGFTQYVLGHSLATYGKAATDARGSFMQFGTPPWGTGVTEHFGLSARDFDGRIVGYTAENDPTLGLGTLQLGVQRLLAAYRPWGDSIAVEHLNALTAHLPPTYISAYGLPDWLSPTDKAVMTQKTKDGIPGMRYDPNYGPSGAVAETQIGDGAANVLVGSSSADRLIGRGGSDRLTGGQGGDSFVFEVGSDSSPGEPDLITDFGDGDQIDLGALAGSSAPLQFIGPGQFTSSRQVRVYWHGSQTFLAVTLDADPEPELLVRFEGRVSIRAHQMMVQGTAGPSALPSL